MKEKEVREITEIFRDFYSTNVNFADKFQNLAVSFENLLVCWKYFPDIKSAESAQRPSVGFIGPAAFDASFCLSSDFLVIVKVQRFDLCNIRKATDRIDLGWTVFYSIYLVGNFLKVFAIWKFYL